MADVKFTAVVDAAGAIVATQKLDAAWDQVQRTGKTTTGVMGEMGGAIDSIAGQFAIGAMAVQGFNTLLSAGKQLLIDSIKGAIEEEKSQEALRSALLATGRSVQGNLKYYLEFAQAQSRVTRFTHEQVEAAEAYALQLTHNNQKVTAEAIKGAIGLSAVYGGELKENIRAVTFGYEGIYRQIGMMIPAVREAKTDEEKHAAMVDELAKAYRRAQDEIETTGGKLGQIRKFIDETKDSLGQAVIQTTAFSTGLQTVKIIADSFSKTNFSPLKTFVDQVLGPMTVGLAWLGLEAAKAAKQAEEMAAKQAVANAVQSNFPVVVWQGVDALKNFNPFLTNMSGTFSLLPSEINETGLALGAATARIIQMTAAMRLLREQKAAQFQTFFPPSTEGNAPGQTLGGVVGGELGKLIDFAEFDKDLAAQFDQVKAATKTTSDEMAGIWDTAMGTMLSSVVSFGTGTGSVFAEVGKIFANFVKTAVSGIEMMTLKQIWSSKKIIAGKQMESTSEHIANIFKSVPFPFDLILAAGAFAVVNALFSKLMKFKEGGVFRQPTIVEVGHGTEYVLPEAKLINLVRTAMLAPRYGTPAPAMAMAGGPTVNVYFNVYTTGLSDSDIRKQGAQLKHEVEYQMRRLGR